MVFNLQIAERALGIQQINQSGFASLVGISACDAMSKIRLLFGLCFLIKFSIWNYLTNKTS